MFSGVQKSLLKTNYTESWNDQNDNSYKET